jgi:hypothetical protein
MGAKASKATQAQDRMKKIKKLEEQMKLPAFVEAEGGRGPKLTLAKPPPVGLYPIRLQVTPPPTPPPTSSSFSFAIQLNF